MSSRLRRATTQSGEGSSIQKVAASAAKKATKGLNFDASALSMLGGSFGDILMEMGVETKKRPVKKAVKKETGGRVLGGKTTPKKTATKTATKAAPTKKSTPAKAKPSSKK
ncbi:hypothetical protein PRIPAC_95599 [Pristionchus pacificus]|uniref:Uncharacterized protein n=1 Tax=Pristionchus pacificus TaxID=54126 RepID=A0A2A6D0U1_PRIPA|nr:hypothetical protein PRIPAC_95599 [Pristionchus pacificus]|eukprot:PDM83966.1 hypothetical protein PRIPAC_34158 [Pristionchus pacificus]